MTDADRDAVAESLLAVIFSYRPTDTPEHGQAWALSIATTVMARAVLASVGPKGDAEPLLDLASQQVAAKVVDAQSQFIRQQLQVVKS